MIERDYSDLVARIYNTALNPGDWPIVLEEVGQRLGGRGAMLFEVLEGDKRKKLIPPYYGQNYEQELVDYYIKNFNDIELEDQRKYAKLSAEQTDIELIDDTQIFPDAVERNARPNISFLQSLEHEISYRAGALLNKDSWNIDRFSVQYSTEQGPPSPQNRQDAILILPHLAKALRIGRPLIAGLSALLDTLQKRIDELNFGVALVNSNCELLISNLEFDRITEETGAFRIGADRLVKLRDENVAKTYHALIKDDQIHGKSGANPRNQSLSIASLSDNDLGAILVEISPASSHPSLGSLPRGTRLITALDATKTHHVNTDVIRRFYPLSDTECDILSKIARGFTNVEIAEARGRTVETVKTQTRALLRKTHTRNRTELIQLAISINSPFSQAWL